MTKLRKAKSCDSCKKLTRLAEKNEKPTKILRAVSYITVGLLPWWGPLPPPAAASLPPEPGASASLSRTGRLLSH